MQHQRDIFRQLAPFYSKTEEESLSYMENLDLGGAANSIRVSTTSLHYSDLTLSLSSSMPSKKKMSQTLSNEDFVSDVNELFSSISLPPINQPAYGYFMKMPDIPPILLCEGETIALYEELLYGDVTVDKLVNSRVTHLLERFLYMRHEHICNAYISYVRQKNNDTPSFEITPRSLIFAGAKLNLNEVYIISLTITNRSNSQQTIFIEPIPNLHDVHFHLELSQTSVLIKKGKSTIIDISIIFTKRSINLSKLILFTSGSTRDIVNISATSKQKVFAVDPEILPTTLDQSFHIPTVLYLLKQKLLSLHGCESEGVFRISGSGTDINHLIEYIDDHGDQINSISDIPCDQVNIIAPVIKAYFRCLPVPILNTIDLSEFINCSSVTDCYRIIALLSQRNRELLTWIVSLFADVDRQSNVNQMNSTNLARMLAPNCFTELDDNLYSQYLHKIISFFDILISHFSENS